MIRKRISAFLCTAALILCAASPPAYATDRSAACYYPVEVESYTAGDFDQPRIRKVYQLSRSDDPAGIPTDDFVEYGRTFHLMEMTRKDEIGVDTQPLTKTITTDSSTGDLGEVLKQLAPEITAETEDGHSGTLKLDYNSVQVEVKGYRTSTKNLSASRVYPNLSDADLSLVPKTVQEGGRTLNLADVKWSSSTDMEGEDMVVRYTATASYTGSVSSRYATGYTVTADYTGEVAKTNCEIVTYTAIFGCTEVPYIPSHEIIVTAPQEDTAQEDVPQENEEVIFQEPENVPQEAENVPPEEAETEDSSQPASNTALSVIGCMGGIVSLAMAGMWGAEKLKERKLSKCEQENI